ncbi:PREDICTED: uncharacterized protein LOC106103233 isoform X2 [Papilio polytes]|nr:PREDICTED: uncharacterized protein LOC106103233 isoform X2 [Papilio polytes]
MPWMGVLIYKPDNHSIEEVTNIVLIEYRIAIGNAKEIGAVEWDSLEKHSRAMFYDRGNPWFCRLIGRILHPEYDQGYINTLVILFFENINKPSRWRPIQLIYDYKEVSRWIKIYNVGYKDNKRRMRLEQDIYPVDFVSRTMCEEFYFSEEINFEYLWPPHTMCYKAMHTSDSCVMSSGMALASNSTDGWILLGLSTTGPGCALPGRYIEILPYVKWIKDHIEVRKTTRRAQYYHEAIHNVLGYNSFIDMFFSKLKDKSIVMEPKYANYTQIVKGCYYDDDFKTLMYLEEDIFMTQSPIAVGVYALLFFDMSFEYATCVKLYTMCVARTDAKLFFYTRTHHGELPQFVKTVPSRPLDIDTNDTYKMIRDPVFIRNIETHHLEFKFTFDKIAMVNITFFGKFNGSEW